MSFKSLSREQVTHYSMTVMTSITDKLLIAGAPNRRFNESIPNSMIDKKCYHKLIILHQIAGGFQDPLNFKEIS